MDTKSYICSTRMISKVRIFGKFSAKRYHGLNASINFHTFDVIESNLHSILLKKLCIVLSVRK